jgi:hypothetical protein
VIPFLVSELEENLFAFRVFEPLTVLLEKPVRPALASDPDHQRLLVVHAAQETLGPFSEQPVGRTLEEQERRSRFQLRIALEQYAIPVLELAEMLFLLHRQVMKDLATASILGDSGGTRVELETAAFGGDCDSQCVTCEDEVGMSDIGWRGGTAGATRLARAVDLHDALRGRKAARRGDFFNQAFDVGAQKLE